MSFEKARLDQTGLSVDIIKNRIDSEIQKSSSKKTLLSKATIHEKDHCAFDQNSNTVFISITTQALLHRDGYDCCAMVDTKKITFIECGISVYKDCSVVKCKTLNSESNETIRKLIEAKRCLSGNRENRYITLNDIEI